MAVSIRKHNPTTCCLSKTHLKYNNMVNAIYGMFVSPQIHTLKSNSQLDIIWKWVLRWWLGYESRALMSGISALKTGAPRKLPHPFYHVKTQQKIKTRKQAFTRHQFYQCLKLWLPSLQNFEKCLLFKPPTLWYFC